MGLQEMIDAAEAVGHFDEIRQSTFREEFWMYENCEEGLFSRTHEAIANERKALDELAEELNAEEVCIDELVEHSEFLTVEQAVRHREQAVKKLEAHNEHLHSFHDAMVIALDKVEANLVELESNGPHAVGKDPEQQFKCAYDALETHNEAVENLDTNLTILNAYLR